MTNVPGFGFLVIVASVLAFIPVYISLFISVLVARFQEKHPFINIVTLSFLLVGIISTIVIISIRYSATGNLTETLAFGFIAYLAGILLFAVLPLGLGVLCSHLIHDNTWDTALYNCSIGWVVGSTIPVLFAITTGFISILFAPLTGILGSLIAGLLDVTVTS